jgi:hypothetical protein
MKDGIITILEDYIGSILGARGVDYEDVSQTSGSGDSER